MTPCNKHGFHCTILLLLVDFIVIREAGTVRREILIVILRNIEACYEVCECL